MRWEQVPTGATCREHWINVGVGNVVELVLDLDPFNAVTLYLTSGRTHRQDFPSEHHARGFADLVMHGRPTLMDVAS